MSESLSYLKTGSGQRFLHSFSLLPFSCYPFKAPFVHGTEFTGQLEEYGRKTEQNVMVLENALS